MQQLPLDYNRNTIFTTTDFIPKFSYWPTFWSWKNQLNNSVCKNHQYLKGHYGNFIPSLKRIKCLPYTGERKKKKRGGGFKILILKVKKHLYYSTMSLEKETYTMASIPEFCNLLEIWKCFLYIHSEVKASFIWKYYLTRKLNKRKHHNTSYELKSNFIPNSRK